MQEFTWDQLIKQAENAGGGDPVPSADYPVVVAAAEAKISSTGKPMVKCRAKIQGGPYDGKTLFTNFTLSVENDNAVAIFMRHMAAFGLVKEYFLQNPTFEQTALALVGRSAIFEVGQKTYNGELRNEVKNVKPAGAGIPQVPVAAAAPAVPGTMPVPSIPTAPIPSVPVPTTIPGPTPVPPPPAPPVIPAPSVVPSFPGPAPVVPVAPVVQPIQAVVADEPVPPTPAPPTVPPF